MAVRPWRDDRGASMRGRFAAPGSATPGPKTAPTSVARRSLFAFNSPFWPFVLATTSVGQEGLDFHLYCHSVVHWNLPHNPVDLEQREGRVHRYKGHAIRKNVAMAAEFPTSARGPWTELFDRAADHADDDQGGIMPYWVYPTVDGARIERRFSIIPFSREASRLPDLLRSTAYYRLAFGQPAAGRTHRTRATRTSRPACGEDCEPSESTSRRPNEPAPGRRVRRYRRYPSVTTRDYFSRHRAAVMLRLRQCSVTLDQDSVKAAKVTVVLTKRCRTVLTERRHYITKWRGR